MSSRANGTLKRTGLQNCDNMSSLKYISQNAFKPVLTLQRCEKDDENYVNQKQQRFNLGQGINRK